MTQQDLYGPPHGRRPNTPPRPLPPMPQYGGRRPEQPPYAPPVPDQGYDQGYDPGYSQGYDPAYGRQGYEHGYDPRYDDRGYDPRYDDRGYDDQDYEPGDDDYDYEPEYGPAKTNTMAILGLVFAFLFTPLGLLFSIIGLRQTKRRYERGRGLAITGLILSLVFLAIGTLIAVVMFTTVGRAIDAAVTGDTTAALPDSSTDTGAAAEAGGVLGACQVIMPAFLDAEQQITAATTPEQLAQSLGGVRTTLVDAAATAGDAAFVQHVQQLANDFQQLETSLATGQVPSAELQTALTNDGFAVGQDCGLAGWTP